MAVRTRRGRCCPQRAGLRLAGLWLTPTMLDGDAANDFFVTGSNAGMYLVDGDIARRVATETGDKLPETIEIAGRP